MNNLVLILSNVNQVSKIRNMISWSEYGFHQIHTAVKPSQIDQCFSAGFPDLIIIDAQFPGAHAFDIIQHIQDSYPETQIIVITAEKNFELAQKGINLQIAALLLWDELCPDILTRILERIIVQLDDHIHRQGIIKRQLFRDILKGKLPTSDEIRRYFEIREATPSYVMFLIKRDIPTSAISTEFPSALDYYAVNWHGSNFPEELTYIATVSISMHVWCSLLQISKVRSYAKIHYISHRAASALQESFKRQVQDTVSIAWSYPFSDFDQILSVVQQLDECLEMQRYYGRARLCSYADYIPAQDPYEELFSRYVERFSTCIFNNDEANASEQLQELFSCLAKEHYDYSCVSHACRLFYTILNRYCVQKRIATLEERFIHQQLPDPYCYGIAEITDWFVNIISVLIQEKDLSSNNVYSPKIQEVIDYLEKNYSQNIDINFLANNFHLSSDYLRHLFKKETGINLTNYITNVKLEKAKLLLSIGQYRINEIAQMTGFSTSQYFGTVFRKHVGITPKEFILQCKVDNTVFKSI